MNEVFEEANSKDSTALSSRLEKLSKNSVSATKGISKTIKKNLDDADERKQKKRKAEFEQRQVKFLEGQAKMVIELPSTGYSGAARAGATLALGIIGYAATKGGKTKRHNVVVKVTDDKLQVSGQITSDINISDIKNTMFQDNPPILTLNFNDGSTINFRRQGSRRTYPSILNDMIKERLNKLNDEKQIPETNNISYMDEIKKAKELFDIGAISEEEFEEIKNKYLNQL